MKRFYIESNYHESMKFRKGQFLIVRITNTKPTLQASIANKQWEFAKCTLTIHSNEDRERKALEQARKEFMGVILGKTKKKRMRQRR
jgi:hypothetical protein